MRRYSCAEQTINVYDSITLSAADLKKPERVTAAMELLGMKPLSDINLIPTGNAD